MHNDRTQGPPKRGEVHYMIPRVSREACKHGAFSEVCDLVLDAVSDLDCRTGKVIIDRDALNIASYLLAPLLEVGTARQASALKEDHPLRNHVQKVGECIRGGNILPLIESVWRRSLDRSFVVHFIAQRYGVYEISHANAVCLRDEHRKLFLRRMYHIALAVLTPADVQRGLPDPCHSFHKKEKMSNESCEVISLRRAA